MHPLLLIATAATAASVGLLLEAAGVWTPLPLAVRVPLLGLGLGAWLALLRRPRSAPRLRHGAWLGVVLAALALPLWRSTPSVSDWPARAETRLQRHFDMVRDRVLALEDEAVRLGDAAYVLLDSLPSAPGPETRVRLFDALDALVGRRGSARAVSTPSIRLFDATGQLLAWAGTNHSGEGGVRLSHFAPGPCEIYWTRSGAGTYLAYDRQDGRADARSADSVRAPRVLVEMPARTAFGSRRHGATGCDLAAELSSPGLDVDLHYESRSVPPYLTQKDIEIQGDPERGLLGDFVVRGSAGAPRVLGRLSTPPRSEELQARAAWLRQTQGWLVLLAACIGVWTSFLAMPASRRRRPWEQPLPCIAALWALRLLLGWLGLPWPTLQGPAVLSPAVFALDAGAFLLRTPVDLVLTALTLLATAALLFVRRLGAKIAPGPSAAAGRYRRVVAAALAAALAFVAVWLGLAAATAVARNTSLPLLGPELDLTSPPVLCVHGALLAGLAAWLLLALLGINALTARRTPNAFLVLLALVVGVGLWLQAGPLAAVVGIIVLWGGARLHRLLMDERFTSFGIATFVLVALSATLITDCLQGEDFRARQTRVLARADEVRQLVDEVRPFVLEKVLQDLESDPQLQPAPETSDPLMSSARAFEIWSGSMLRQLRWPCQVRIYDDAGSLTSDFSIGLPYQQDTQTLDIRERARAAAARIEQTEIEASPIGTVRLYRGALPVRLGRSGPLRGFVVVDLPFAHESLILAANPSARTPKLLQAGREAGPRVEESQLYLLAWLHQGFVTESSSPYLEVGEPLRAASPAQDGWRRLPLQNGDYLVTEFPAGERTLLAGFRLLEPLDRLLQWTQVAALDFAAAVAALFVLVAFGRWQPTARSLPPLLVPKRFGFQQKLMGAFLVVALLPSVVVSLATHRIMLERSKSRNRDAAIAKVRSAEAALSDVVRRELQSARSSEYVEWWLQHPEWWLQQGTPPARDIPDFSTITIFHGDGRPILDETLSSFSDADGLRFVSAASRRVFASREGVNHIALGALEPVWVTPEASARDPEPQARLYYLYYRRRLTDGLLRELAPILNTDISGFLGPQLVVSSQKSLAAAGVLPYIVPPAAFESVLLRNNRSVVVEESTGDEIYDSGYLPLEDRFGQRIGALAVQQLLQADDFAVEVERTRALVVGLSTSMFVLTLALAVAFAARIFDPVRNLIEGTRRIAGGNLDFRLRARAGDEIGELERSFNDMAARLQTARAALEERRRYLEAVLGNIASGVVATDVHGRITATNAAACRILGLPPHDLAGRPWQELARAATADAGTRSFWTHIGAGGDGDIVELGMRRGEDRLTLRVIVTDLRPSDEVESLGRVAIFEDLSELIRSKKLAAWAEMARQVAHEIKNPLTPLKLSAQFMEQAYRDKSPQFADIFTEGMQTIVQQVDVLRRIASEFSGFGRMQKLEPRPLELGGLLRRVIAPYRSLPGIEFDAGGDGDTTFPGDGIIVRGDDEGLRKVFTNILENAREAMGGAGRIALRVENAGSGQVQVVVTDEGVGLTPEARDRLFEPYFSTKTTGTGLGLAITRSILEELGGSITLTNRPGGGAEVRVTLPV